MFEFAEKEEQRMDNNNVNQEFDDLEALFGTDESDLKKMEKTVLTQNLEGFASCFPDWDLHPPRK